MGAHKGTPSNAGHKHKKRRSSGWQADCVMGGEEEAMRFAPAIFEIETLQEAIR